MIVLQNQALNSTCHGLPNIFRSENKFLKTIWISFCLFSTSICFYVMKQNIDSFFKYETITAIDDILEIPTQFPTVSICQLNLFKSKYAQQILNKTLSENNFYELANKSYKYDFVRRLLMQNVLFQINVMGESFGIEQRKNLSLTLEDMLISCNFGFRDCSAKDFDWFYDSKYGNCFKFNGGQNSSGHKSNILNSMEAGETFGLKVKLFIGNDDSKVESCLTSGIHVFIHNHTVKPQSHFDGINIASGAETNIIVNRVFDSQLGYPFGDCKSNQDISDTSEFYRIIKDMNVIYNQHDCLKLWLQSEIIKMCKCYYPFVNKLNGTQPCFSFTDADCYLKSVSEFYQTDINKLSSICSRECDTIKYKLSTSFSDFPTQIYYKYLLEHPVVKLVFPNGTTFSNLKKTLISFNVFYDDLKYIKISQKPKMIFEDLVANVGGTLGLFMGISFLTLSEIFAIFYQILYLLCTKSKRYSKELSNIKTRENHIKT